MSAGGCNPIDTTNIRNFFGITNNIYGKALFGQTQKKHLSPFGREVLWVVGIETDAPKS